jgi:hypothetical protein
VRIGSLRTTRTSLSVRAIATCVRSLGDNDAGGCSGERGQCQAVDGQLYETESRHERHCLESRPRLHAVSGRTHDGAVAFAGFIVLAVGLLLLLPRGFTGGSSYSRIAPIGSSYIQSTPGYRDDSPRPVNWRRVAISLALVAIGVVLLVLGL